MATPVSVLIVEDEMIIAAKISLYLEQMGYHIAGIVPRGEAALAHCRSAPPDLLLLDIQLKGEMDGVEVAAQLMEEGIRLPTIFLTANTDDATFARARRTYPHAFLEKPFRKNELHRAICLAVEAHLAPARPRQHAPSTANGTDGEEPQVLDDRVFIRHKDRMIKIYLRDILYVRAERAYCHIKTRQADHTLSISMGRLAEQLSSDDFVRAHRSYLVNLRRVDAVADGCLVVGEEAIPISRGQQEEVLRRVNLVR